MTAKKLLSLLLAVLMVLSLVACASTTTPNTTDDTSTPTTTEPADNTDPADEPDSTADAPSEEPAPSENTEISLPLVTEPTTLHFWWPSVAQLASFDMTNASDYLYFTEMEERTGVTVEIEVPNDAQTQFGLMMASEEYPDFVEYFASYYTQGLDHAIDEDLIVPLEEYAEYIPNIMGHINSSSELHRQAYTDNGHLGGIPMLYMRRNAAYTDSDNWAGYVVRQDWLDELNLEVPSTYDELSDVLAAFKTNYSDYIPFQMTCFGGSFMMAMGSMFWSGYNFTADWMQIDGQVVYSPTSDGYRDYLQMLNSWYNAGYIDPDIMSATSLWTTAATAVSDQYGVFPIIYTHMGDILSVAEAEIPGYTLSPSPRWSWMRTLPFMSAPLPAASM